MRSLKIILSILSLSTFIIFSFKFVTSESDEFQPVSLKSKISGVQPMTGIVLWEELDRKDTDAIQRIS